MGKNLILNQKLCIDEIYLYAEDSYEPKYQILIKKRGCRPKAFVDYLNNEIGDIYETIEECNANKERRMLIVFDDLIADMLNNKNLMQQ